MRQPLRKLTRAIGRGKKSPLPISREVRVSVAGQGLPTKTLQHIPMRMRRPGMRMVHPRTMVAQTQLRETF